MDMEERLQKEIERQTRQLEKTDQAIKRYENQKKRLEAEVKKKQRKTDTHNKIVMGGVVRSVLGRDFKEGDDRRLLNFLKMQERNGHYFTKAMNRGDPSERETMIGRE